MNDDRLIEQLRRHETRAPEGFAERVMDNLPAWRKRNARRWWPARMQWLAPALAGAAVMAAVLLIPGRFQPLETEGQVSFHFELHAPGAHRVELLGTFNNWKPGDIVLNGPDASGHWTATVALPEGRHEYIFLVDGERWVADPNRMTHRPDGFGRVNTVIKVYDDGNV